MRNVSDPVETQVSGTSSATPSEPARRADWALVTLAILALAAGVYLARDVLIPVTFAVVLAVLFRPVVRWLEGRRVPPAASAAVITLVLIGTLVGTGFALAHPVRSWVSGLPDRFEAARGKLEKLRRPVEQINAAVRTAKDAVEGGASAPASQGATSQSQPASAPGSQPDQPAPPAARPPADASAEGPGLLSRVVGATTSALGQVVTVTLLFALLLASGDLFARKLEKVCRTEAAKARARAVVEESQRVVRRYLWVTLLINLAQGALVALVLWWLKMPAPWVWGLATVVLEFIPYLGAIVMVALLAVVGVASFDSVPHMLAPPAVYLLITTLQNNVVSPVAYGNRLKLNPVTVLVAVMAWWLLWGVPGAFLAVPIVATLKVVADHVPPMNAVGEWLGE